MRHEISPNEAAAIRKARQHKPLSAFQHQPSEVWNSIALTDAAASGSREAAEKLQELRDLDAMEERAGTQ